MDACTILVTETDEVTADGLAEKLWCEGKANALRFILCGKGDELVGYLYSIKESWKLHELQEYLWFEVESIKEALGVEDDDFYAHEEEVSE